MTPEYIYLFSRIADLVEELCAILQIAEDIFVERGED